MSVRPDQSSRVATSRLILAAILTVSAVLAMVSAILFEAPQTFGRDKILTDFDAFHIAGEMARQGRAGEAYQATEMFRAQKALTGTTSFMPWTYPPPYTLAMEGLARLPIGLAYLLFITASFAFYLLVLRRIAGSYLPGVLIGILPVIILVVRTGQNGFLIAGLVGWFLLAWIDRRPGAGIPLGLMVVKPHLAAGIALLSLLSRRWAAMVIAALVVSTALATATLVYGTDIWPAFLGGVDEAGEFLAAGYYPLFRMTSIYATVRSLGAPPSLAISLHALGALAAVILLVRLWYRGTSPHVVAAAACASSMFVSPYNYDYDLAILGLAAAFLLPDLIERARRWELQGLLALSWLVTGYGIASEALWGEQGEAITDQPPGLISPFLILLLGYALIILRRGQEPTWSQSDQTPLIQKFRAT